MDDFYDDGAPQEDEVDVAKLEKKRIRIEREKAELLKSLAADDFSTLKNRVAAVLNISPSARDSDIALCLRYWEMFQPDLYNEKAIAPADLFKLERLHYIVRARAMIQNEYGLFVANEVVRKHRKKNEQTVKAEILAEQPDRSVIKVFADETGKTGKHVMVAAVWVLSGFARFKITRAIDEWRESSGFGKREIHFSALGKSDGEHLNGYLNVITNHTEFLSFKIIGVERSKTRRPITEVVARLHEHMIKTGVEHEISTGRVQLPRTVDVTIDEEDTLDQIALADMKHAVEAYLAPKFNKEQLSVGEIRKANSKQSSLLQLADLIAGSVNRIRNHEGEPNHKDIFARQIVEALGLAVEVGEDEDFDSSTVLPL